MHDMQFIVKKKIAAVVFRSQGIDGQVQQVLCSGGSRRLLIRPMAVRRRRVALSRPS